MVRDRLHGAALQSCAVGATKALADVRANVFQEGILSKESVHTCLQGLSATLWEAEGWLLALGTAEREGWRSISAAWHRVAMLVEGFGVRC